MMLEVVASVMDMCLGVRLLTPFLQFQRALKETHSIQNTFYLLPSARAGIPTIQFLITYST